VFNTMIIQRPGFENVTYHFFFIDTDIFFMRLYHDPYGFLLAREYAESQQGVGYRVFVHKSNTSSSVITKATVSQKKQKKQNARKTPRSPMKS